MGRLKKLRRLAVVLLMLPLVLWLVLSLFLSTSLGTGVITSRIEKKIGLRCELSRAGWTPWSGFFAKDLVLSSPDDFSPACEVLRVEEIALDPLWKDVLRKRVGFENLVVESAEMNLPIELLKHLAQKDQGPVLQQLPPESVKVPLQPEKKETSPDKKTGDPAKPVDPKVVQEPKAPEPQVAVVLPDPGSFVSLKNFSLRLYSIKEPNVNLAFTGLSSSFPLSGGPGEGALEIEAVTLGQGALFENLAIPLVWDGRSLVMEEQALEAHEFHFALSAALSPVAGFPYGIRLNVPEQSLDLTRETGLEWPVTIESFSARQQLNGYLLHPRLVQGNSISVFKNIVIEDSSSQSSAIFDWGQASIRLTPAGLFSPDFRWVGEHDAVLGNGYLQASGEGAAVVRLVGSAERASIYQRRAAAYREGFDLKMRPLETPDRWFSDLRFDLSSNGLMVSLEEEESSSNILP